MPHCFPRSTALNPQALHPLIAQKPAQNRSAMLGDTQDFPQGTHHTHHCRTCRDDDDDGGTPFVGKSSHSPYTFLYHIILQHEVLTVLGETGKCQHSPRHSAELHAGQKSSAKPHTQHLHESSQLFKLQRTIFTITALTGTNEKSRHLTFLLLH